MSHRPWIGLASLTIAAFSFSILADQATAQNCNFDNYEECMGYYRTVSTNGREGDGIVETSSGIGLNIRSGPGLNYPVISGVPDGELLVLTNQRVEADGYLWGRLAGSGWVAVDYVVPNGVSNVSYYGDCNEENAYQRPVYYTNCSRRTNVSTTGTTGSIGGTSKPVQSPSYVVVVPGNSPQLLARVQQVVGGRARPDRARQGPFINAGVYTNYYEAHAVSDRLRSAKLDARVAYRRLT